MKIAHLSDLHYCPEHLDEVDRCVSYAVDKGIESGVDCWAITGDVFDHQVPVHSPAVAAVLYQVQRMADHAPIIILQGTFSHDVPGSLDVFRTVGGVHPVCVVDRICQVLLMQHIIDGGFRWVTSGDWACASTVFHEIDHDVRALFSCLPPVNKAAIAAVSGTDNAAQAAGEYVHQLMTGWAVNNEQVTAQGIPTIVLSHGTVNGCMTEQGVVMHGTDHEMSTGSLFASKADAIMLGHIHQQQDYRQGHQVIAYPGSVGRLHFGEITDKGFLIWTLSPGHPTELEFIPTPAKRLLQIECGGPPDMTALAEQAATAGDAHVRIRYTVDEEHKDSVDKAAIAALFDGAAACKIEGKINPVIRTRAAGITARQDIESKLEMWAGTADADTEPLLERLRMLQHMSPADIADAVVEAEDKQEDAA